MPADALSDEGLIERAVSSDEASLSALWQRHLGLVFSLLGGRSPDTEDIAQDVFLEVRKSLPGFRGPTGYAAWLTRITLRAAGRHYREERRWQTATPAALDNVPGAEGQATYPGDIRAGWAALLRVAREWWPAMAEKAEKHLRLVEGGEWDRLPEEAKKVYRDNKSKLIRRLAGAAAEPGRRGFLATALGAGAAVMFARLGLASLPDLLGSRSIGMEQFNEQVGWLHQRRVGTGEVARCRAELYQALALLPPRVQAAFDVTPAQAEVLLRAADLDMALSLDAFDVSRCENLLLPRVNRLLGSLHTFSRLVWQRRALQGEARLSFHRHDFQGACRFARVIADGKGPEVSRYWRESAGAAADEAGVGMLPFELGSFTYDTNPDVGLAWWAEAHRQLASAGDHVNAARVQARLLRGRVECAPAGQRRKVAGEAIPQLAELERCHPQLLASPLYELQHRTCQIRCLVAAGRHEEAAAIAPSVVARARELGYHQGVRRVLRAVRSAPQVEAAVTAILNSSDRCAF